MSETTPVEIVIQESPISPTDHHLMLSLASPWRRIGAVLINLLIFAVVVLPFSGRASQLMLTRPMPMMTENSMNAVYHFYYPIISNMMIGFLLFLVVLIWQWVWMSRYGQSIGKRLLRIKVISVDGQNPGFNGTVLIREVSFRFLVYFGFSVIVFISNFIGFLGLPLLANVLASICFIVLCCIPLICVVMLFITQTQRRTLQDMLAKTMVVYQPKS